MESQDTATDFFFRLWPQIEANKNRIATGAVIVVFAVAVFSFISWRHEQNQVEAGEAMTGVLMSLPPNAGPAQIAGDYLAIADEHGNTPAGERALLQGAAAKFTEGKFADAQIYFQQFIDKHPDNEFSGLATLGVAKCLEAQGKVNEAAGEFQHIINDIPDPQTVTSAKFALAEIDVQEEHYADAERLFQEVAQGNPYSAIGSEAAQNAFELKPKLPAPQSAVPATSGLPAAKFNLSH